MVCICIYKQQVLLGGPEHFRNGTKGTKSISRRNKPSLDSSGRREFSGCEQAIQHRLDSLSVLVVANAAEKLSGNGKDDSVASFAMAVGDGPKATEPTLTVRCAPVTCTREVRHRFG